MEIQKSYLAMIKAMSGGWGAMCGALAMTRDAVENRIYERKGQSVLVETAMAMQSFSGTTLFAEAIATASGGTFIKLPDASTLDFEAVDRKFRELVAELGQLSADFSEATKDDHVDKAERRMLEADAARIHRKLQELLGLTFKVYCPNGGKEVEAEQ